MIVSALLLSLDELPTLDPVCDRISRLSERWWALRLPEAAVLAPPALSYLLQLAVAADHKTTVRTSRGGVNLCISFLWPK